MKKILTFLLLILSGASIACHNVSLTELNAIDNGDGTYTYEFELCVGVEDTWGFYIDFSGSGNLVGWQDSVTAASTGNTIGASVPPVSGDGVIEYGDWDDTSGPAWSGSTNDCVVFTLTFDDPISSITVDGLQPNYNPPGPGTGCSVSTNTDDTLPVELTSFKAERDGSRIEITWTTGSEQNSDKFILISRKDKHEWKPVDSVKAAGNSIKSNEYKLYDKSNDLTYYKLIQLDLNGDRSVYGPIHVRPFKKNRSVKAVYNLKGIKVSRDYKGVKIIHFEDGSVSKVY